MHTVRPHTRSLTSLSMRASSVYYRAGWVALLLFLQPWVTSTVAQSAELQVSVSIPPQQFFLEQIAGELVSVSVLLQKGGDPHSFSPTTRQMSELSHAKLLFTAGLSAEQHWVPKLASLLPSLKLVEPQVTGLDEHFWLSPIAVIANVKIMRDALSMVDPGNSATFAANTDEFIGRVNSVHEKLQGLFGNVKQQNHFLVQHSAWDIFADQYGLEQIVIAEEGKSVTVKQLSKLISRASNLQLDTIFSDLGHGAKEVKVIAEQIDAEVQTLDPLSGDWINNLLSAASLIKAGLR